MAKEESEASREIRYRPISAMDLLIELQTISNLMVDLAYSSVLFTDRELAQEVVELEDRVEDLRTLLMINVAVAARSAEDAEAMVGIMRLGTVAEMISNSAGEIASIVLSGLGVDQAVLDAFTRTAERLIRTRVLPGSILVGKSIGTLRLEAKIGVDIMAIRRGRELHVKPDLGMRLLEGDVLIARGSDVGVAEFDGLAKGELKEIPKPGLNVEEKHP